MSRVIEPQPGLANPATRDQQWHVRHLRGLLFVACFGLFAFAYYGLTGQLRSGRDVVALAIVSCVWAALFLSLAWYLDPKVRQKRYLRKHAWVEYDANVSGFNTKVLKCVVTVKDDSGRLHNYRVEPNDDDYERGRRAVWFAGTPGKIGVVSLRDGACTGMAYPSQFVPDSARVALDG